MLFNLDEIKKCSLLDGFEVQFIHSNKMTFAFWDVEKGAELPAHSHHHEQVVHILEGELLLNSGGVEYNLKKGEIFIIPSNQTHFAIAITACRILDTFCPVREDYVKLN